MIFDATEKPRFSGEEIPEPVYDSVVRSLYKDRITLTIGILSTVIAAMVLWARQPGPFQIVFAGLFLTIGAVRLYDSLEFEKRNAQPMARATSLYWEKRYAVVSAIHVGLLGLWAFLGFAISSDEFVHQMSVIIMLSNLIGILGRNFASEKVVLSQTMTACLTIIFGTVLFGGLYDLVLAVLLVPLFYAIWSMSENLRRILFSEVLSGMKGRLLAHRFDVALSNVSHGLAMLDAQERILVANGRFSSLCGLGEGDITGLTLAEAVERASLEGRPAREIGLVAVLGDCLRQRRTTATRHEVPDGRVVEALYNPMAEGGVVVLEDITERMAAEKEIRTLASFDPLTHLPNRRFFAHEVNRVLGMPEGLGPCTLLFVDLDNFKDINDSLGHAIGDKLLCSIALRMRSRMSDKAMICRFGGDEFVIVVPGRQRRKEARAFAEAIIEEVAKPLNIDGHLLTIGASIGISQSPANGSEYSHLLKVADMALYDAKAQGRNRVSFYSDELGDQIRDRKSLESDLRHAIARGQLQVHYQPLVDVERSKATTCEALLRWTHPERGQIPPSVFIPIAEEIGLISALGKFVVEEATAACRNWPGDVAVAVNVSSLQFQQSDIVAVVRGALSRSGLEPKRLQIEVTESAMLDDIEKTRAVLTKLGTLGVRISLDDFGTGFSSLSYLHVLPLDKVKIDRSFIENIHDDPRSMTLLSGVCQLAAELGLAVVVEGVETDEQMRLLIEKVHVDEMQGYLFGKAMAAADIARLLDAHWGEEPRKTIAAAAS